MREIIFRGKRVYNGEWVYGGLIKDAHFSRRNGVYIGDMFEVNDVDSDTVGQYTGLKDKTGKPIYEADIIHCTSQTDAANMVVIFEKGEFRMVLCEKYNSYVSGGGYYAIGCFDKEVIGNIHDNPDLLLTKRKSINPA